MRSARASTRFKKESLKGQESRAYLADAEDFDDGDAAAAAAAHASSDSGAEAGDYSDGAGDER